LVGIKLQLRVILQLYSQQLIQQALLLESLN